jgi:radical SAM protein with 4Fe4S-binding SPASM domain
MRFPIQHIIFEVTQDCNLSCLYCYNHWRRTGCHPTRTDFKETERTLHKIFKTIDFEHITFTGGEPFLADGVKELVLKCRMKGKGVTIISNGTTASPNDYRIINDMGVSMFELPLHSESAEIHDKLTGCNGSFQKVIESIKNLTGLKAEICVVVVVTKLNIAQLQNTLEFAEHLGIKRLMIARFNIGGRGIENVNTLLPSLSELRSAFYIANSFAQNRKVRISANVCVPGCIINPQDYPNIPVSFCGSDILRRPVTIDAFGNIRICNHSPHIIGNIHKESITSIFESKYLKDWDNIRPQYCTNCNKWNSCRGGCRAASEQFGGSLLNEDPIISIMEEATPSSQEIT